MKKHNRDAWNLVFIVATEPGPSQDTARRMVRERQERQAQKLATARKAERAQNSITLTVSVDQARGLVDGSCAEIVAQLEDELEERGFST